LAFPKVNITFASESTQNSMAQIEYITVKNASKATLNKLHKIGVEKAKRLQRIQERWEAGEYSDVEIIHV
jgi:DNA uptake protein ComE-like DNA-binding protein